MQPAQVFVGNGSDEVLAHTFMALLRHARPILFPDISYSFYPVYCKLYDVAYRTVPLDDTFSIRVVDYGQANGGIIIANPNAPTGRALPLADIEVLLKANPDSVVVVDEATHPERAGDRPAPLLRESLPVDLPPGSSRPVDLRRSITVERPMDACYASSRVAMSLKIL